MTCNCSHSCLFCTGRNIIHDRHFGLESFYFYFVSITAIKTTPSSHTYSVYNTMKTCALLSALVLASASEDTFTDDGLSLLQLRATTQGNLNDDQSPCLCSIVVDTATQGNAETGGGGVGRGHCLALSQHLSCLIALHHHCLAIAPLVFHYCTTCLALLHHLSCIDRTTCRA